jgi:hypothetical protein
MTSESIIYTDLHNPNNKLVNAWLEHFWCTNKPWAYTNSQESSRPKLEGNHHLPFPLIIFFIINHGATSKCHFVPRLPSESLEIPKIVAFDILEGHNFL